jgi:UDP-N-acetylmuramate--alanine ligase
MDEFVESFEDADIVLITEIYAARENPIAGINGCALADRLRNRWPGKGVQMVQHLRSLPERVAAISRPGDIVLALGAGNITNSVPEILQLLKTGSVHT